MIQEFNNVSRKSFKNYTSKDLNLQPVNVIFGMNGSGKSALAEWLYDSSRTDTQLFNTDYVEREIRVRSSINGVHLIVGSDIEETEKVEEKRKERDKIEKDIAGIESEMEKAENSLAHRIQEIFTKERKKFNNINIRQKPNLKVQPHVVFEKWEQEAKNGEDLSEDQDISGNDDIERRIDALKTRFNEAPQPFEKEDIELVQKELITQLSRIVIKPHEEFTQSLLDWLSSGKELHDQNVERQTCKFCGNEFITREVFKRIENAVSAEYSQFCQKLNSLSQALERIKKSLTTITQKKRDE